MSWVGRIARVAGAAAVLGLATASPAWGDSTIPINPGNVPTAATGHDCDSNFGGGPYPDKDVWVFVLPKPKQAGTFVSVTATFSTPGGSVTKTIPGDGGAIVNDKGTSKAWIATSAGWTLTGATAKITGSSDRFNLTHTCAAGGGGNGGESPSPSASASPSATASKAPGGAGGASGGTSSGGGLPVTGAAVTSVAVTGGLLVAGGAALLLLRRRLQGTR